MAAQIILTFLLFCAFFLCFSDGFSKGRLLENGYEADLKKVLNCVLRGEGCEKEVPQRRNKLPYSSVIYLNGIIYTVDGEKWDANPKEAIVIEDGKIEFVGSNEEFDKEWEYFFISGLSIVYDLDGAVILPGLHDIHMHPLEAMSPLAGACKLPNLTPPDYTSFTKELKNCSKNRIGTEWVLGAGHSITPMLEYVRNKTSPKSPKKLLDSFINDRPAAMLEETSHSAWVNSKALEKANITNSTHERPGGVIMREPYSNEPNGILFENEAIDIFALAMNATSYEILDLNYVGLLDAMGELAQNGITSVCDARLFWKIGHDIAWEEACYYENLSARAVLGLWAYPNEDDNYQISELKKLYSNPPRNKKCSLRKTQIKVYMDGIVQSTTAAIFPYR